MLSKLATSLYNSLDQAYVEYLEASSIDRAEEVQQVMQEPN